MKNLQSTIQTLLEQAVSQGQETGVQAVAYQNGKLMIDAFAGVADSQTGLKVTAETLFPVFSTTKGIAATAVHLLAERGTLNYETPVSLLWPEFGKHGKEGITIRHVLNHTAGLPYIPHIPLGVGLKEMGDWDSMCAALADLTPASAPGERFEYHAITYGWLVGEIVRRVDGRDFSRFMHEEICDPLGIETMFCGLPAELEPRVAILEEPNLAPTEIPVKPTPEAIPHWVRPLGAWMNRSDARRACLPASNGIMNARAIARHYAALLPGGVDDVELLPLARIEAACACFPEGPSQGLGYRVGGFAPDASSFQNAFGHGGYGGSFGCADPESGWAVGWTRNRFDEVNAGTKFVEVIQSAL